MILSFFEAVDGADELLSFILHPADVTEPDGAAAAHIVHIVLENESLPLFIDEFDFFLDVGEVVPWDDL